MSPIRIAANRRSCGHTKRRMLYLAAVFAAATAAPGNAASVHDILSSDRNFSIFRNAVDKAALMPRLRREAPVTLFLPSDQAMHDEGSAFLLRDVLVTDSNKERLLTTLSQHIHFGVKLIPSEISEHQLYTEDGGCIYVYRTGPSLRVGPEAVVTQYISADDGVIFVIDRLLWQPWYGGSHCPDPDELG
jgi:uncharacterized surface protein with fasciclin (FAS1) repeats